MVHREHQFDLSGSTEDKIAFSKVRTRLLHALSSKETFLKHQFDIR